MTTGIPRVLCSTAIVSVAGLALSACTVIPGSSGPLPPNEESQSTSSPSSSSPASGTTVPTSENPKTSQSGGASGAESPGFSSTPATALGTLNVKEENGREYQVDVNSVVVHGEVTLVNFTVIYKKAPPAEAGQTWGLGNVFTEIGHVVPRDPEGKQLGHIALNAGSANGLVLIDPQTGRKWKTAYETSGMCMCSRNPDGLLEGQSQALYAIYAPLPEDITSINIDFPNKTGRIENIPVTRK